ncbi:MAG: hypothetical protein ACOVOR_02935 [Rhabdochlamydiaceae bacterium]
MRVHVDSKNRLESYESNNNSKPQNQRSLFYTGLEYTAEHKSLNKRFISTEAHSSIAHIAHRILKK